MGRQKILILTTGLLTTPIGHPVFPGFLLYQWGGQRRCSRKDGVLRDYSKKAGFFLK
jgi:hypothetical protein